MDRWGWFFAPLVVIIIVIVAVDVFISPATCALNRNILLPDTCGGSCPVDTSKSKCCTTLTTRPYGIFFTQAASCSCPSLGCGTLGENKSDVGSYVASKEGILGKR